jgi:hypothetical protein
VWCIGNDVYTQVGGTWQIVQRVRTNQWVTSRCRCFYKASETYEKLGDQSSSINVTSGNSAEIFNYNTGSTQFSKL